MEKPLRGKPEAGFPRSLEIPHRRGFPLSHSHGGGHFIRPFNSNSISLRRFGLKHFNPARGI